MSTSEGSGTPRLLYFPGEYKSRPLGGGDEKGDVAIALRDVHSRRSYENERKKRKRSRENIGKRVEQGLTISDTE